MQEIRRAAQAAEGSTYQVVASTPALQRDGFSIPAEAWRLETFRANPVLLWAHRRDDLDAVIGRADVSTSGDNLVAEIEFAHAENEFAAQVKRMWDAGYLRAVSVGGAIKKTTAMSRDATRVDEIELLDLSVVPIGADPAALAVARAFSIPDETVARMFQPAPTTDRPRLTAAESRLRLLQANRRRSEP